MELPNALPQRMQVGGEWAMVSYTDSSGNPVPEAEATTAYVAFDNGDHAIYEVSDA